MRNEFLNRDAFTTPHDRTAVSGIAFRHPNQFNQSFLGPLLIRPTFTGGPTHGGRSHN